MTEQESILIHIIPSNKWGGTQTYAFGIARHFHDNGWRVEAFTRNAGAVDLPFRQAGISLFHAPLRGGLDLSSATTLAKHLRQLPTNARVVIHTHRYRDAVTAVIARHLAKRPEIRIVNTRHSVRPARESRLFRWLYPHIDAHIFVSNLAYESFCRSKRIRAGLIDPKRVFILRDSIHPADLTQGQMPASGPTSALYFGPIVKGKGLESLIDALALLSNLRLRLRIAGTGDPDYLDLLRRRAQRRGVMDRIDWSVPAKPNSLCINDFHFAVAPSVIHEAGGISNIRYMAAGMAQITSNSGAQTEFLSNRKTALIVPPGDASSLADAMQLLASNPELRNNIGREAANYYNSHLAWEFFIDALSQIYNQQLQ